MSEPTFPIKSGTEWTFEKIQTVYDKLEEIVDSKYKLDYYPNQIDIVTSEQMLDAYAGHGMPIMYKHWSFGKSFLQNHHEYMSGNMGLAYEMVINSSPCINYLMEENNMGMQTLVLAHAAFGHNSFFKTNYLFKQWTDAEAIIDYLMYANDFVAKCEERYGVEQVEKVLDAAHAWQYYGVDKYTRSSPLSVEKQRLKDIELEEADRRSYNHLMDRTVNKMMPPEVAAAASMSQRMKAMKRSAIDSGNAFEPQENILYFIEKHAPTLPQWKRELIRIVRRMAQYFYPQIQTKVMNEGFATFMHYHLVHDLREEGLVDEGMMLEFYHSHTGVVRQPDMSGSFNPYALGFNMFMDIKRVCNEPTQEDRDWFAGQEWVGRGDWIDTVKWAAASFKDESFIRQFLSPKVMRDMKMFAVEDDRSKEYYRVMAIHDTQGYRDVRARLADRYIWTRMFPELQVAFYDSNYDRSLYLQQVVHDGMYFDIDEMARCGMLLATLWEFPIIVDAGPDHEEASISIEITPEEGEGFDIQTRLRDPSNY